MAVENWVAKEIDALTEFRRDLHRNPELLRDAHRRQRGRKAAQLWL